MNVKQSMLISGLVCFPSPLLAGEAVVKHAGAQSLGGGEWRVEATIRHDDTGWDHYANAFEVLDPDGNVLGTRVLYHPHVEEQPFTRSLTLSIPEGIKSIRVRAVDSVHGTASSEQIVKLQ